MRRAVALGAGAAAAGAAAAAIVDLLDGADPMWTVAAMALLVPPAAVLAAGAWRTASRPAAALCWLGVPAGPVGAALGDRAGASWPWLALEAAWLLGLALASRPRPGLVLVTAVAAVAAGGAAVLTGLHLHQPVAAGAGLRTAMTAAWAAWVAVHLATGPNG
jgi:hypothetical protein